MECVAYLCQKPVNSLTNGTNPFHDDISFNDKLNSSPKFLGNLYDCIDLSEIIYKYYYNEISSDGYLDPLSLSEQISLAFVVLKRK